MVEDPVSLYAQWRLRSGAVPALRENGGPPPERLLQAVWHHQRIQRERLATIDGQRLQVLHPGFWNYEGGPDFRGAIIQFEGAGPRQGDVEIDLEPVCWRRHGHDKNPAFRNVILQVVWEAETGIGIPTLPLRAVLDAPVTELAAWLGTEAVDRFPEALLGQCCAPLAELAQEKLNELLAAAGRIRLHSKGARFQARAREAGWEQALWEGIFRALGYKHNIWPMQRLAELRPRVCPSQTDPLTIQSRLFGLSGLLPPELTRRAQAADVRIRGIWDCWWRERAGLAECVLPRELWRLHGLRPANHPERRLALATQWLAAGDLAARLERWCARQVKPRQLVQSLSEELQVQPDPFWNWHWTLRSQRLSHPQPLLGQGRLTELAVNVVLPWLWIRAAEGRNSSVQAELEQRFFAWPAGEDNAVLRLADQRLFGGKHERSLRTAAAQQGLLQIVRDFCEQSDAVCTRCQFPLLAKLFQG